MKREFDGIKKAQEVMQASPWALNQEKVSEANKYMQLTLKRD